MPKSFFYSDLLRDHEQRTTKHFYTFEPSIIKVKSKPGQGVNLAHTFRLRRKAPDHRVEGGAHDNLANYSFTNVATLKYAWDAYNLKTKIGNQNLVAEIAVKPAELNSADQALSIKHNSNYEPSTGVYETTNGFKYGSPLVGPVRFWTTLDHVWSNKGKSALKPTFNAQIQDEYHFAWKFEHDLAANALKSAFGVLAWKTLQGDYFFKSECLKHHLILGCNHRHSLTSWQSYEVMYDLKNQTQGIQGHPLTFLWTGEWIINPFVNVKTKVDVKKDIVASFAWNQIVNLNLRIVVSDHYNLTKLFTDPSKTNYNFGCLLEYSI